MRIEPKDIYKALHVPYWIVSDEPKPSAWRHPLIRLQAWWWARG